MIAVTGATAADNDGSRRTPSSALRRCAGMVSLRLMPARSHSPRYGTTPKTTNMPSFCRNDVILVAYPFSDRTGVKVRPAVVVSGEHRSQDVFVVPLTSKADRLLDGEFSLADWQGAGLNVASVVKPGLYTIHESLVIKMVGRLVLDDASRVDAALRRRLDL